MKRMINEHFRYGSGKTKLVPKKGYESEIAALCAIDDMKDKNAVAYECSICGKWHIGHNRYKNK